MSEEYLIVNQRFKTDGESLTPGTPVDASGWKNTRAMLEVGFLKKPQSEEDLERIRELKESNNDEIKTYG